MNPTASFDMAVRHRQQGSGLVRVIAERLMEAPDRQARRCIASLRSMAASGRSDMFTIDRRSFFEAGAPERG